jgi:hypothetical protein
MRYHIKPKKKKIAHEIIIRRWFAFLPFEIDGEVRWLEYVNVEGYWFWGRISGCWVWKDVRFIDNINPKCKI